MTAKPVTVVPDGRNAVERWETRLKLVGLSSLILAFAVVDDLRLLPLMIVTAVAIFRLAGLPWSLLVRRMKVPGVFLLTLAVVLPLFSGETILLHVGPVAVRQEGVIAFISIATRFASILTIVAVLFATTPIPVLVRALRSLGLPSILADLLLFTYRYIFQLADDMHRAHTAARLRGARFASIRSIPVTAYIFGTLLVRSEWQSHRVLAAMVSRGYGVNRGSDSPTSARGADVGGVVACAVCAAALVAAQALLV